MDPASQLVSQAIRFHQAGRLGEAEAYYRKALQLSDGLPEAHCNLGILLHNGGRLEESAARLRRAVQLNPQLGQAWNNLGVVLKKLAQPEAALAAFRQALSLAPRSVGTHYNLALLYRQTASFEAALQHARTAHGADPSDLGMALTLGDILLDLDRADEAAAHFQRLAQQHPPHPGPLQGLGMAHLAANRLAEAGTWLERMLVLVPDDAEAHFTLAVVRLLQGDFARGFAEYEWRLQRSENRTTVQRMPGPAWTGESLEGKSLLVHTEQGLGDLLHFLRYLPRIRCARLTLEVPRPVHRLLSGCVPGLHIVAPSEAEGGFDAHVSVMSLARIFGTRLEGIPAEQPALAVDQSAVEAFRALLGLRRSPRVGLCWRGSPTHWNDRRRSLPADLAQQLIERVPGVEWIGLQIPFDEEANRLLPGSAVLAARIHDVQDTAALMANLDLVVSVDTAVAHLAGCLGLPAFVLLPFTPDWRWMLERSDSPWYPSLRLFRQPKAGDWNAVVQAVAEAVRERAALRT